MEETYPEDTFPAPGKSDPREVRIIGEGLVYGHIEAWTQIIRSYQDIHVGHRITLIYKGEPVQNITTLFKMNRELSPDGFQLVVTAPDGDFSDVSKLNRLLTEGTGPEYQKFVPREVHRILPLF